MARQAAIPPEHAVAEGARLDRVLMRPRPLPRVSFLAPAVPYLRLAFPAFATLAVIAGLVWPLVFGDSAFRLSSVPVAPQGSSYMRMESPRFTGSDGKDRQFNITAESAVQKVASEPFLDLKMPKGDLTTPEGSWMSLTADVGRYDQNGQLLNLTGKVELFRDDGYQVSTEKAVIDLRAGVATGDAAVAGQGPAGHVNSEGFKVSDRGKTIEFTGKAHLVLYDADHLPGAAGEKP